MFATDPGCGECVIVHNNWLIGANTKIYRFKEFLMWAPDPEGYYSSPHALYLTYDNPLDFGPRHTGERERSALRTALRIAYVLNRTLILPTFHCYECPLGACRNAAGRCSLFALVHLSNFDLYFKDAYREHVFLLHSKVPETVKNSQTGKIYINTAPSNHYFAHSRMKTQLPDLVFTPVDRERGASSGEIRQWLSPFQTMSVIRFHSLYDAFRGLTHGDNPREFEKRLWAAVSNKGTGTIKTKATTDRIVAKRLKQ